MNNPKGPEFQFNIEYLSYEQETYIKQLAVDVCSAAQINMQFSRIKVVDETYGRYTFVANEARNGYPTKLTVDIGDALEINGLLPNMTKLIYSESNATEVVESTLELNYSGAQSAEIRSYLLDYYMGGKDRIPMYSDENPSLSNQADLMIRALSELKSRMIIAA